MARATYHHGDLRAALVDAGLEVTRAGGPEALSVREVTRRAGVSPNAAYRHFTDREALLGAVSARIQEEMVTQMAGPAPHGGTRRSRAITQLQRVGQGYVDFALAEPGWFAVAFFGAGSPVLETVSAERTPPPFVALVRALDQLVEEGVLTAAQRDGAEWPCWATVHGFAELALRGPLQGESRESLQVKGSQVVRTIIAGLGAT